MTIDPNRRILIIDNDAEIRHRLSVALRNKALVVDEAADGTSAIRFLSENSYAVVLLDLIMPDIDGFHVLDTISASPGTMPVVLVVTGAERRTIERLDARRIHGIINKPFDPDEVAAIVAACADVRGRSAFDTMAIATLLSTPAIMQLVS